MEIDASGCLLIPILDALSKIQARASELSRIEHPTSRARRSSAKPSREPRTGTWSERWAPAEAALENLDRIMELEKIPRSSLHCDLCSKEIDEGYLRAFHDSCYHTRFEGSANLRPLKDVVQRDLQQGHAVRELVLGLPDALPKIDTPGLVVAILHLLRPGR